MHKALSSRVFIILSRSLVVICFLLVLLPALAKPYTKHTEDTDNTDRRGERIVLIHHFVPYENARYKTSRSGQSRSQNLARFITANYGRPDYIFTAGDYRYGNNWKDSLTPLSEISGVRVDGRYSNGSFRSLAQKLLTQPQFEGKLIVISWNYNNAADLARALNADRDELPANWNPRVANALLQFDYPQGNTKPEVLQFSEPH
jgi:hypothetical protein